MYYDLPHIEVMVLLYKNWTVVPIFYFKFDHPCLLLMKRSFLLLLFSLLISVTASGQVISETNTDVLLQRAQQEYRDGKYKNSLALTQRGLELAPEYHDIRILQVRNLWALERMVEANADFEYLLEHAPHYPDLKPLAKQRFDRSRSAEEALDLLDRILGIYPDDLSFQVKKASLLIENHKTHEARALAKNLITRKNLPGKERYILQNILKQTISNEIGINYQYIDFSQEYSRSNSWNNMSGEYQHSFNRTVVLGRVTYSDRQYDQGMLYELEAYPVFNDRLYAFTNFGFSKGEIFPNFRSSASLYYNFAKTFEAEVGARALIYDNTSFFTGILGLTAYSGKFYLNSRIFLGPERRDHLVQNYQFNVRYYFGDPDNYLFLRLGNGISPDESALYSLEEDPLLDAWYGSTGINKSFGIHHIFQVGGGVLHEEITTDKKGTQFIGTAGYRYRF